MGKVAEFFRALYMKLEPLRHEFWIPPFVAPNRAAKGGFSVSASAVSKHAGIISSKDEETSTYFLSAVIHRRQIALHAQTPQGPDKDYLVYVLSESADKISLVRFGPKGASVERTVDTGSMPTDID